MWLPSLKPRAGKGTRIIPSVPQYPRGALVPTEKLYFGIDWGRTKDHTWVVLTNAMCDVVDMLKVPHMRYERQVEEIVAWLTNRDYYMSVS